ncbi:MAG: hypothetical protein J7L69_02595 [Desulfobulbaceae bacterium]|nr:hypothetical protein [Desulfobulbaceae bacterium]
MFPTDVGMNRTGWAAAVFLFHVPHRRGDEPAEAEACNEDFYDADLLGIMKYILSIEDFVNTGCAVI